MRQSLGVEVMKLLADVGELGWSIYIDRDVEVITYPERYCLYKKPVALPVDFPFNKELQDGFGFNGVEHSDIIKYFKSKGIEIDSSQSLNSSKKQLVGVKVKPYEVTTTYEPNIIVFPRCRTYKGFSDRNLSEAFYRELLQSLCVKFNKNKIISIGSTKGAYNINLSNSNYNNLIGKTSIQEMIDIISSARVCIGGASAPPKFSLLQGTPTYVIGHEKHRVTVEENWSNTKVGFCEIPKYGYAHVDSNVITAIMRFVDGCK